MATAMTDATVNLGATMFRPGTSDAEIEAAAAKAAKHRKRMVIFWRLAILVALLVAWEGAARLGAARQWRQRQGDVVREVEHGPIRKPASDLGRHPAAQGHDSQARLEQPLVQWEQRGQHLAAQRPRDLAPDESARGAVRPAHVLEVARKLQAEGLINLNGELATANPGLMQRAEEFATDMRAALEELEKKHAFERG